MFGELLTLAWYLRVLSFFSEVGEAQTAVWFTVICAYALTFASSRHCKDVFYSQLQRLLRDVPSTDHCILVGDFNARVGSGVRGNLWDGVRGCHGFGSPNSAGVKLLSFAAVNDLSLANTCFPKRDIFNINCTFCPFTLVFVFCLIRL